MAERRMFTKKITESDAFLDMPSSTQCLYFHLNMSADDDGFVNNPKRIQRLVGATDDDFKLLVAKSFVILFESGIIVIKHWKMHNYIQSDRYKPTDYIEEKSMLGLKKNKSYTLSEIEMDTKCIQDVSVGKDRLGKDSIDKDNNFIVDKPQEKVKKFVPPTVEEVKSYCFERNNGIDAEEFVDFYTACGWVQGKARKPIKDWKACVRTWEKSRKGNINAKPERRNTRTDDVEIDEYTAEIIELMREQQGMQ